VLGYAITNTGTTCGVWGESLSENGIGVYGNAPSNAGEPNLPVGVFGWTGSDQGVGVIGLQTEYTPDDLSNWAEPGGFFAGRNGVVVVTSDSGGVGLAVEHTLDQSVSIAVRGETASSNNNYGLYTQDNLYSLNYNLLGAIMQVVQNGGDQTLEAGDVVVFSGIAAPLEAGGPPVIQVARADAANSPAVAGVVYSRFDIRVATGDFGKEGGQVLSEAAFKGPIAPGEYLLLVVQGPTQVKVSALSGTIQAGDLLSSAGQAGYAAKAAELNIEGVKIAAPGTVFGKALEALEALDEEDGLIYIFVTLQ